MFASLLSLSLCNKHGTHLRKCEKVVQHDDKALDQGKGRSLIFQQNDFCNVELSFSLYLRNPFFIVLIFFSLFNVLNINFHVMDLIPFFKVGAGAKFWEYLSFTTQSCVSANMV